MAHTFTIPRRPGCGDPIKVEIDCDEGASFAAKVSAAVRARANLGKANLYGADLGRANLYAANLGGANLSGANLIGANLGRADLYGANLGGAYLYGANLGRAYLGGADLSGARLGGANLYGANLGGALIQGEKITRLIGRATRLGESYEFCAFALESGGYKIRAGCRWFTDAEYRAHLAVVYPDTPKARETLRILDYLAACAANMEV